VALGALDYPPTAVNLMRANLSCVRFWRYGKYHGRTRQLTSTRNADGSYTQVLRCSSDRIQCRIGATAGRNSTGNRVRIVSN